MVTCPTCGAENPAAQKFCGECGSPLRAGASAHTPTRQTPTATAGEPAMPSVAERRLVSVLFADLVGFTTLSESRDAEEVRELLSRYFDTCKRLIARYGGIVEKFIGDAVMAIWFAKAQILLAEGKYEEALRVAETVFAERDLLGIEHDGPKESFVLALELGRVEKAEALLTIVERLAPGLRPQFLNANVLRFRAHLALRTGDTDEAERLFKGAGGLFQEIGIPFYLAVTRLEHAEWLSAQRRGEEAAPLLGEAREIFVRLQAKPWIERVERVPGAGGEAEALTTGA